MPKPIDRFARALTREHAEGNAKIKDIVDRLIGRDRKDHEGTRGEFACCAAGWRADCAWPRANFP